MDSIFLFLAFAGIAVSLAWGGYSTKPEHGFLKVLSYIGAIGCLTGAIAVAILAPIYNREIEALKQQLQTSKAAPSVIAAREPSAVPPETPHAVAPTPTTEDEESNHFYDPFVTPQYLTGLFRGRTDAQGQVLVKPYIGRIIGVSGKIHNISAFSELRMDVTFQTSSSQPAIVMSFGPKWFEQLEALHVGDKIDVLGMVQLVRSDFVALDPCQIVSVGNVSKTK